MIDGIVKFLEPIIKIAEGYDEKNYLVYGLIFMFILMVALLIYIGLKIAGLI